MKTLSPELARAVDMLRRARIDASDGLPEALFLLVSGLMPVPNVDLLVTDEAGRILLSRRNDPFFEESWHIPGGCLRYGESPEERIRKTALAELGCEVSFNPVPLAVRSVRRGRNESLPFPAERGHNLALLYACRPPSGFVPDNRGRTERDNGFLRWFHTLPADFMNIQHVYDDVLSPWIRTSR